MQEPSLDVVYAWIRRDHDASQKVARHAGMRRDEFSFQGELASAMSKPECERWVIFRPWVDAV